MSDYETILVEHQDDVVEITLNRPDSYNALTHKTAVELIDVFKKAKRNPDSHCILLTGAGKGFCAGQDLKEVENRGPDFSLRQHLLTSYNPMVIAMRTLEKPIIAAINGATAGAGLGLALACDIRYASEKAKFLTAFIGIGLAPDTGVSYWLPRLIGPARAAEMLFTNDRIDARQAMATGLINKVFPHDTFLEETRQFAQKLATAPTRGIGLSKRALNRSMGINFEDQLDYEAYIQDIASHSADYKEGVSAFRQKRSPEFKGN